MLEARIPSLHRRLDGLLPSKPALEGERPRITSLVRVPKTSTWTSRMKSQRLGSLMTTRHGTHRPASMLTRWQGRIDTKSLSTPG